jgi:hypothetical protein
MHFYDQYTIPILNKTLFCLLDPDQRESERVAVACSTEQNVRMRSKRELTLAQQGSKYYYPRVEKLKLIHIVYWTVKSTQNNPI